LKSTLAEGQIASTGHHFSPEHVHINKQLLGTKNQTNPEMFFTLAHIHTLSDVSFSEGKRVA